MRYNTEEIGKTIKKKRKANNLTQKNLGSKLGISGKQVSSYENGQLIPPMDILLKMCDIFNCELGFLLGEKDYEFGTKLDTTIQKDLHLSPSSINALRKITGNESSCLRFGHESETYQRILNTLLSSDGFINLIDRMRDLDYEIALKEKIFTDLEVKYGKETLLKAYEYHTSTTDYLRDENAERLPDIFYEILLAIDNADFKDYDSSFRVKLHRYEVSEAFSILLDELYPTYDYSSN